MLVDLNGGRMATVDYGVPARKEKKPRLVDPSRTKQALSPHLWSFGSIMIGLAIWEVVSRYIVGSKLFLAAPTQIAEAMVRLAQSGELEKHTWTSASEFLLGYSSAALLGIVIGLVMANSERAKQVMQPWVSGLYATPTVALAPLFILWFGIGIFSKVVVVAVLVVFPVIINTETGLKMTNRQLIETVRSFGASRAQIFFKVSLPSALPFIFAGLKLGIGRGLIGVVVAELFGARSGLGQLISQSAETFNMPNLFAGVILAVAGIALTAGFSWLERRLLPWNE
jgi:NitT/TauT family transport system permease protein